MAEKDFWDKLDISAKIIGAILVPVALAGASYYWNDQINKRATAAVAASEKRDERLRLFELAASVIQSRPDTQEFSTLITWATTVITSPNADIPIPAAAQEQLKTLTRSMVEDPMPPALPAMITLSPDQFNGLLGTREDPVGTRGDLGR